MNELKPNNREKFKVKTEMNKEWIELKARGPMKSKDSVTFLLVDSGSTGVLEEEDSKGQDFSLTAYYPIEEAAKVAELRKDLKRLKWSCTEKVFEEYDWHGAWKKDLKTINVSGLFTVKPTWKNTPVNANKYIIDINPGMAFGTGSHETTRLCLKSLAHILLAEGKKSLKDVLDVGTGTGILAIGAALAGAKNIIATDIDPVAVKVARENCKLNKVKMSLTMKELGKISGSFNIVFANILAGELMRLSDKLTEKVKKDGYIILSGILNTEAGEVMEHFLNKKEFKKYKKYKQGEWSCIVLKKS